MVRDVVRADIIEGKKEKKKKGFGEKISYSEKIVQLSLLSFLHKISRFSLVFYKDEKYSLIVKTSSPS